MDNFSPCHHSNFRSWSRKIFSISIQAPELYQPILGFFMIAYFILVHRYPEQFKRLFRAIYNSENSYLIHIDKKSNFDLYKNITSYLKNYANVFILESQNVVWGGYSMVDVEMKAIQQLLKINNKWQFFINLSGQDFPIKSQNYLKSFLLKNKSSSFIKIANQIKERPNTLNRIKNYFTESANGFTGTPIKRSYLHNAVPFIGGQWKILTRECCDFICSSPKVKKFERFYKNTLIPDESFFQTVLMNTNYAGKIVNDDKRAIIWIPDFGPGLRSKKFTANTTQALIDSGEIKLRPKTLTQKDARMLLQSTALFARKLDESVDNTIFKTLESSLHIESPSLINNLVNDSLINTTTKSWPISTQSIQRINHKSIVTAV